MKQQEAFNWWKEVFIATVKAIEPSFVIDQYNRNVIDQLCLYFAYDPKFNGDLDKGIFLAGSVGAGKTLIMETFMKICAKMFDNEKRAADENYRERDERIWNARIVTTNTVGEDFLETGVSVLSNYYAGSFKDSDSHYYGLITCFDDLGTEPIECKHMGNLISPMAFIISKFYEKKLPWRKILFTSNLNAVQVESHYGTRIRSRLREMVNMIELLGNDRRK